MIDRTKEIRRTPRICVDVKRCRLPVKTPGFSWSFTGYKADLTPAGVLAHELGHHCWSWMRQRVGERSWKTLRAAWQLASAGARISSYEPNSEEAFAESCKLFVTNPELLRAGRLSRYAFFEAIGLRPLHRESWRDVLAHAHPRLIAAAEAWIVAGRN